MTPSNSIKTNRLTEVDRLKKSLRRRTEAQGPWFVPWTRPDTSLTRKGLGSKKNWQARTGFAL